MKARAKGRSAAWRRVAVVLLAGAGASGIGCARRRPPPIYGDATPLAGATAEDGGPPPTTGLPSAPVKRASFPLSISPDRKYLVDADGAPFFVQGNSAWSLAVELSSEDVRFFLDDRRARGFNAIVVYLTTPLFSSHSPRSANALGAVPFADPDDFTTTNEAYFEHVDSLLREALARGILVILAPSYTGYGCGEEGWCEHMKRNGPEKLRRYGLWLGQRYRPFPNIAWLEGGDYTPSATGSPSELELVNAVAEGIKAGEGGRHLHTVEWGEETSGGEVSGVSWLDLDSTYTYSAPRAYTKTLADFARDDGVRPFFNFEPLYENEHGTTPTQLRSQMYQPILSGATGFMLGVCPVWGFWAPGKPRWKYDDGAYPKGWKSALDTPGTRAAVRAAEFFRARPWFDLRPDIEHQVMPDGYGSYGSDRYVLLASTKDGRLAVAYYTARLSPALNLGRMAGTTRGRWFDPAAGNYLDVPGSPFASNGLRTFTPPDRNSEGASDWVLVLEAR